MQSKEFLEKLFLEGLESCSPEQAVRKSVRLNGDRLSVEDREYNVANRPVYLLAVGKASIPMCKTAMDILGNHIKSSLCITSDSDQISACRADEVIAGDHPIPKKKSLVAGKKAVRFTEGIPRNALVLNLISGGTSSLMCLPPENITIDDLNRLFQLLNNSGATIREINTVRKHCSQIKGGQLLEFMNPDITLLDLAISDVPGGDLSMIGSGPTIPDLSTFQDAYHILLQYELWDLLPPSVQEHFEMGIDGQVMETLKPKEDPLAEHHSYIISSAEILANDISKAAIQQGFSAKETDAAFNDDVEIVAEFIAGEIKSALKSDIAKPAVLIFYGESTVDVRGDGKGGRNQELALRGTIKISGQENITWLSAGTDGVDGPTDAAGAIVDGNTVAVAQKKGLDPQEYLINNDSYHFHERMGTLLKTGPTGNNLMDIVLVFVE